MEVQDWIDDLKTASERGLELRKLGSDVWTRDLLVEEEQILIASADGGPLSLNGRDGTDVPDIQCGGAAVFDDAADSFAHLQQWYALQSLALRGVLTPSDDGSFNVEEVARLRGARLRAGRLVSGA